MQVDPHTAIFFEAAAVALLVLDPINNKVVAANARARQLLGCDQAELRQGQASDLFESCFEQLLLLTQEAMDGGTAWTDALELPTHGGTIRVESRASYLEHQGNGLLCLSLQEYAEIDGLREQSNAQHHYESGIGHWSRVAGVFQEFEQQNQLLLEAAGEGIYGVDTNGNTTFLNPAAERILGYQAAELAGRNMHKMVHHTHSDGSHFHETQCPIFAAFKDGTVHQVEDDIFWSKSGEPVDVEYTSTPIVQDGEIMGAVVVFRDITQRKKDQSRLLATIAEVENLKHRLELENAYLQEELDSEFNHHQIIGKSPAVQNILQQVNMVGPTEATVLIHGESGTGKELIARAIHEESQRSNRPLIRVNCAAIPQDLFESEFFGHVKGAFTGAAQDRAGRFQLADGGSLFLDEVGEIPLHLQSKLLRVLQEQQFERIGEAKTREVDVRIIAATNQDLSALVEAGKFREDLYFRLNVFPIHSAPLRQRSDDIPLLTQHFLEKSAARAGKTGLKISLGELEKLQAYDWPGNIRELENVIERQVILAQGDAVKFEGLRPRESHSALFETQAEPHRSAVIFTHEEMQNRERRNILAALERCKGKVFGKNGAAELLAIKPTTLASKLSKMHIDARQFKQRPD